MGPSPGSERSLNRGSFYAPAAEESTGRSRIARVVAPPIAIRRLTPWQRRLLAWLATACGTVFVILAVAAARGGASDVDEMVKSLVQWTRQPALERTMRGISLLGSGYVLFPLTLILALALARYHVGLALTAPLVAGGAVTVETLVKVATGRHRPNSVAYSYPSAHVLGAMVFFGMLAYLLWALARRRHWWRCTAGASFIAIAVMAFSRLYVNAHWISDVVGGLTGGLAYVLLVVLLLDHVTHTARAPAGVRPSQPRARAPAARSRQ
jgi:membrane-associated phospholipid phosphatase